MLLDASNLVGYAQTLAHYNFIDAVPLDVSIDTPDQERQPSGIRALIKMIPHINLFEFLGTDYVTGKGY